MDNSLTHDNPSDTNLNMVQLDDFRGAIPKVASAMEAIIWTFVFLKIKSVQLVWKSDTRSSFYEHGLT